MDTRLNGGDIALLTSGGYEYITGIFEAVQRVRISALTVKGDFVYDRSLGTDYGELSSSDPMIKEKLDMLIKESCADIYNTAVEVQSFKRKTKTAVITVAYGDEAANTEVDLSGILR